MALSVGSSPRAHVPGSRYARFHGSNAQRYARQVKQAQMNLNVTTGTAVFGASLSESQARSSLAVQMATSLQYARLADITV